MSRTPWMDIAKNEIGQKEIAGSRHNPRIVMYHSHTSLAASDDETYWCASFVCFCLEAAGFPSTRSAAARSYESYGIPGDGSHGDIAVFSRNGGGHVGFVDHVTASSIYTLGGNQSDAVNVAAQSKSRLLCFRRPAGTAGGPGPIVEPRPMLRRGDHGDAVRTLQQALNRFGYGLVVDGDFGPKTDAAVRAFQRSQGIGVDGIVGPITWSRLL